MVDQDEYIPRRGDVVRILLNPQVWYEQSGLRPAVVISPASYNGKAGLALFCPISSQAKGYPFEVALPEGLPVSGAALADQVKSLAWKSRKAEFIFALPPGTVTELLGKFQTLL
ncbi:MAG: mRNA-degrading endonuclease [Candidatus Aminicenantes bacterium RBG_16_63_16]|nr:MAG: mRNA-degrading endonuclease [Candidatus Aminicenantes bacterium RBG_16_63_16]